MEAQVRIGSNRELTLRHAVLIYGDGQAAFATLHEVQATKDEAPYLGPAQSLTTAFLRTLATGLGTRISPEVLPENVLARTPEMMVWWSRAQRRLMFFGGGSKEAERLNGRMYPHPALVFKVSERELFVRALAGDWRPSPETPLKTAPYWNVDAQGRVCLGSMRVPDTLGVDSIEGWGKGFFESEFTHPSGAVRLTNHPGGFVGLWNSIDGRQRPFPGKFLTDATQTLRQFVEADEER